jgi:hypothetical protein
MHAWQWFALICALCWACQTEPPAPDPERPVEVPALPERILFAAPDGAGDACSQGERCTITRAKELAASLSAAADGDVAIELAAGTYRLTEPLRFGPADSGKHGYSVIWRASPNARPVLSGAIRITAWTLIDPEQHLWRAELPPDTRSRQLYVNGERAPIAQAEPPVALEGGADGYSAADETYATWRNPSALEFVYPGGAGDWTEPRCRVAAISGKHITMAQPCWKNLIDRPLLLPPAYELVSLSPSTAPARIENAFELLQPGQWYLDEAETALYYRSDGRSSLDELDIELPVLEQLVVGEGRLDEPVHDLLFQGLDFAYATWNAPSSGLGFAELQANLLFTQGIDEPPQGTCELSRPRGSCPFGAVTRAPGNISWHAARRVRFVRDRFEHLGAAALVFEYGSQFNVIEGNVLHDISGNGIVLGDTNDPHPSDVGADERELLTHNTIANNLISDVGAEYRGAVAILLFFTQHSAIRHNEIHDVPYTAISSGVLAGHADVPDAPDTTTNINGDNEISSNLIYRYLTIMNDGGAIYLEGHQHETVRGRDGRIDSDASYAHGLMVSGNVVYDQTGSGNAFYDDIGSQWITWSGNVQWHGPAANGGCVPIGHIKFIDNYYSDVLRNFGCGEPVDTRYERNTEIPSQPRARDLPRDIVSGAGLEPDFQDLLAEEPPRVAYAKPAYGRAASDTAVLITGRGFTADAAVAWGEMPALRVERWSSNFVVATAPAGAELSRLRVTTARGSAEAASLPTH